MAGLGVLGAHLGSYGAAPLSSTRRPALEEPRQVHLLGVELHEELSQRDLCVGAGEMGENVLTAGVDLLALPAGAVLRLGVCGSRGAHRPAKPVLPARRCAPGADGGRPGARAVTLGACGRRDAADLIALAAPAMIDRLVRPQQRTRATDSPRRRLLTRIRRGRRSKLSRRAAKQC